MWPKRKKQADQSAEADCADSQDAHPGGAQPTAEITAKEVTTVRHRAVRLLARRDHGRHELREKLLQRDLPAPAIDIALDQLAEKGLQCDVRFAESYTRMRVNRGFGPNKITADLQARRLSREIIKDAIADSDVDWTRNALHALLKKYGEPDNSYSRVVADPEFGNSASDRARMQRFLHSRGYNSTQITAAIKELRQRVE